MRDTTPFHCLRDLATACNNPALFDLTAAGHAEAKEEFAASLSAANEFIGGTMMRNRGFRRRESERAARTA